MTLTYQEAWSYLLQLGSLSGLLTLIYTVISEMRKRPRISLSLEWCRPHLRRDIDPRTQSYPNDRIEAKLTVRNTGDRQTSIEGFELAAEVQGGVLHNKGYSAAGLLGLPAEVLPNSTVGPFRLDFMFDKPINEDCDCVLTMRTTHKSYEMRCRCSTPLGPPYEL